MVILENNPKNLVIKLGVCELSQYGLSFDELGLNLRSHILFRNLMKRSRLDINGRIFIDAVLNPGSLILLFFTARTGTPVLRIDGLDCFFETVGMLKKEHVKGSAALVRLNGTYYAVLNLSDKVPSFLSDFSRCDTILPILTEHAECIFNCVRLAP